MAAYGRRSLGDCCSNAAWTNRTGAARHTTPPSGGSSGGEWRSGCRRCEGGRVVWVPQAAMSNRTFTGGDAGHGGLYRGQPGSGSAAKRAMIDMPGGCIGFTKRAVRLDDDPLACARRTANNLAESTLLCHAGIGDHRHGELHQRDAKGEYRKAETIQAIHGCELDGWVSQMASATFSPHGHHVQHVRHVQRGLRCRPP